MTNTTNTFILSDSFRKSVGTVLQIAEFSWEVIKEQLKYLNANSEQKTHTDILESFEDLRAQLETHKNVIGTLCRDIDNALNEIEPNIVEC